MSNEVLVAILALVGTLIGSLGGILAANRLVVYRIEQLEKKVEKHNSVVERMYKLETRVEADEETLERLEGYHSHN